MSARYIGNSQPLRRCLIAAVIVTVAALLRLALLPQLGMRAPFLTFYPAVFIAALFCELEGGVLASFTSFCFAGYFWMEPGRHLFKHQPADRLSALVFLCSGLLVSYAADRLRRAKAAEAHAKIAEERLVAEEKLNACNAAAEQQLRESEAKARARGDELAVLMDTVPAITFIAHDTEGRYISCGKMARQFLGVPEGGNCSLLDTEGGKPRRFKLTKDGKELLPEQFPAFVAAQGVEVRDFELTVLFDDGSARDIVGDTVPLYDNSGKVRGAVGAFLDISERNQHRLELQQAHDELEKRVRERTAELERASEALQEETRECVRAVEALRERDQLLIQQGRFAAMGEMISNIAHQWRQPLNSISLIIQELPAVYRNGEFSEEYLQERVAKARGIIRHMSKTIDDFRNFFRPSEQKVLFPAEEMVAKTLVLIEESLNAMGVTMRVEQLDDAMIYGYPSECSQVLLNLLLNSRDAFLERNLERAREISIRIFSDEHKTVLTIADNAGGIDGGILGKVFDPYFTTKGPDKGTGIGLFMAKNIIENHMNGRISVENLGDGVRFRIEMECAPDADSQRG